MSCNALRQVSTKAWLCLWSYWRGGEAQGLVRQARLLMVLLLLVEQALGQLQVVLQAVLPGLRCLPARAAGRMKLLLPLGCCCFCRCC